MRHRLLMAAAGLAALTAASAQAAPSGWRGCVISHGVLLVPAKAAGLTGQFVLDAATPRSVIDATQASLADLPETGVSVSVHVAGRHIPALPVTVAALDARTRLLPTPITGVLGADVLQDSVLEVWPAPCRFRLDAHASPMGRPLVSLPVDQRSGAPTIEAAVADDRHAVSGAFRIATGGGVPIRLSPALGAYRGASPDAKGLAAPLRALSIGPLLVERPLGAIADAAEPGIAGEIGEPVWSRYGLRLDLRRGRLNLFDPAQQKTRRNGSGGS
jgi:hypothetical protein